MVVVHHLNNSRSQRILWMLEELQVPYELKRYQRDPGSLLAPPELKKIHPLGKSPVITDGDLTLAESGAIIEYLQETYDAQGLFKPTGHYDRQQFRYWMHYAEGSLMPLLVMKLIFSRFGGPPVPWIIRPVAKALGDGVQKNYLNKQIATHRDYLEQHLEKNQWFAGSDFSAADIQMSFPIEAINMRGGLAGFPKLQDFLVRIHQRPAYQQAIEKGGAFKLENG
ncbi:TPA: glutathione S-transferase [Yersinia enterocolitica]|uniref:glutathione S-transferase family protein n=1 Tax=Yersinia enterocolitica TaxID=630 RepID=UPI000659FB21|nr:glutathione S-transferase [Yersinia enterocolitica]EKN3440657.1 glutathione S-transferase [Yersinia enterocolitica]EKN3506284.1 glutathione S-transferase [Yersinia enterocolitica]EKN4049893.1 glutathione S-transferase [Yersinia enterocolitica]EKN4761144.1 glutathione S-transferase [Yersinia enterocolitica]EKN4857687.1 glutathione S-transferase [Yersinia enterocolitica]